MKKKITIVVIFMIISIIIFAILIPKNKSEKIQETSSEPVKKEPVEWHANYIWDTSSENNTWMCFRKKIDIQEKNLNHIIAQIAVDSKYWLYINDKMVVREGALKRGETRDSIYYDEVNLSKYLHTGENTISILVWYWGDISYSHHSSGQGALLFQTKIGNTYITSDETWKVSKHPGYLQDALRPNKRLIEYNVYYDASLR